MAVPPGKQHGPEPALPKSNAQEWADKLEQASEWKEISPRIFELRGYRIVALKKGEGWRYSAFAPPQDKEEIQRRLKVRYERGERVPARRELLGVEETPQAARALCATHFLATHGGATCNG